MLSSEDVSPHDYAALEDEALPKSDPPSELSDIEVDTQYSDLFAFHGIHETSDDVPLIDVLHQGRESHPFSPLLGLQLPNPITPTKPHASYF